MADKDLKKGDHVTWRSHGENVHGTVEQKLTKRTEAAGRTVAASPDDPQYRVRSDKTGKDAVHKPGALKRG
ncbi:hypothetical protein BJY16_003348 [Actinoplanes octamycinicus]|uniref:Hypervirulence associated protein TUDOR domain-containing protein n=1 Tax=Actinoplanes octamycinicus TaxID=135948 RepID=A0A7W7GX24_9ACTN|nr:DUF2945 domain-containing protein [Actinoplanes octamycinicus]MBB4739889.1 hypothetical protein [Actinoplanes octamycinicus]GIE55072.1 hypothetical protein Aoc01nite_04740 [Actinoplanes octamycinicus]